MPALTTPDGQVVDTGPADEAVIDRAEVDKDFARALATPDPSGPQAPPRHDDAAGEQPKRRRGRPRKNPDEQARATETPPEPPVVMSDTDYAEAAAGVVTLGWATLAGIPWTQPYAVVVDANAGDLTGALANGAKHNPKIRAALEKAATGGGGVYMLQLAAVGANMAVQTLELMRDPALRAEATQHTRKKFRAFLRASGIKLPDEPQAEAEQVPDEQPVAA